MLHRCPTRCALLLFATLLAVAPIAPVATAPAQAVAERALPATTRTFNYEFTNAAVVQPLRSGSLLVSDASEMSVVYLDSRTGAGRVVGRTGSGPLEYRTPGQLLLLPGDTTAVYDAMQARLLLISPAGQPIRTVSWGTDVMALLSRPQPFAIDGRGRVFGLQLPPITPGAGFVIPESLPVVRMGSLTATRVDTIASVSQGQSFNPTPGMGADGKIHMAMPLSMVLPADEPLLLPDGRLAILRGDRYVVEWISDGASSKVSAPIASSRNALSAADRKAISDETRAALDANMKMGARMLPAGATMPQIVIDEPDRWPETRPHFQRGAKAGLDGRLYVPVMCVSAADKCFDVLDAQAKRVARYRLPKKGRLLAAGNGEVYVVSKDEDDIEYVNVHRIP